MLTERAAPAKINLLSCKQASLGAWLSQFPLSASAPETPSAFELWDGVPSKGHGGP